MDYVNEPKKDYPWGGSWTEKKLDAFIRYVDAYLTIMAKYPQFKTIYFDGFAGSGERGETTKSNLFTELNLDNEEMYLYQGAAERLINLDKAFDFYYFVEKDEISLKKLQSKLDSLPNGRSRTLEYRKGDCNEQVKKLAAALHQNKSLAALVFLDPFGMQLEWETIAKLRGTRSDIWILIPTGVIVNRLLDKKCKLMFSKKLTSFFGMSETEIRKRFYSEIQTPTLFGDDETLIQKVNKPIQQIAGIYSENLKTIWKHVTNPLPLLNSSGTPIFHFVFASNNEAGGRIAKYIIEKS